MISEMVGFTVFMVMVLGGLCGAVIKYTLRGRVSADAGHRTNDGLWKEAMEQSHLTGAMEMSAADGSEHTAKETEQHHKHGGMNMSHATA